MDPHWLASQNQKKVHDLAPKKQGKLHDLASLEQLKEGIKFEGN